MRNMSKELMQYKIKNYVNKYLVLDGDIDPDWVEAMNTVMDDNKVLTLENNDRIMMTPSMRMILEVEDMRNATLATATRGGCLMVNEFDIGWLPFLKQWKDTITTRVAQAEERKDKKYDQLF